MNLRYTLLSVILLLLAFGFTVLPEKNYSKDLSAEDVLLAVLDDSRYISTDEIASLIINNDPSLQIIDVRKPEEFKHFSLPGAINIPLDSLLTENSKYILSQNIKKNVFYSNGSIYASQFWLLAKRMGYKKVFIMQGGLNHWVETILQPKEPKTEDPYSDFANFQFRKGASQYFMGGTSVDNNSSQTSKRAPIIKRKKKPVAGGC